MEEYWECIWSDIGGINKTLLGLILYGIFMSVSRYLVLMAGVREKEKYGAIIMLNSVFITI